MSCVIEGFYVRFFWDWLAFISGAFRWKVFAVFADDVGETSSLSPHAALLTPCPIAINAALDTVVNIRRGLMNGRQISSMEPLLFPFFSSPVDGSIKLIRPSVIMRTSSTLSRALLNHPTDISSGTSITTVCRCCMHCSAAFSTHGLILLYGGLFQIARGLSTQNLARRRPQLASEHTEHFCRSLPNPARIQTQYPVHQKAKAAFASSPCRVLAYLI